MENFYRLFKSLIDVDRAAVVICNLEHTIVYMNPAAIRRYEKRGGAELIGRSLLDCHNPYSRLKIEKTLEWFAQDTNNDIVHSYFNVKENSDVYTVALRDESRRLIGYYEKHECRTIDKTDFFNPSED